MRLVLSERSKIYKILGSIVNQSMAKMIIKEFDIKEPLESFLLPVKRRVCGRTWTEI